MSENEISFADYNEFTKVANYDGSVDDIYSGCNSDKGCFGDTDDCISGKNCSFLTTFYGGSGSIYTFEILGKLSGNSAYVASALSFDTFMGNDSVVTCILNKENNTISALMYWNEGKNSIPLDVMQLINKVIFCC